MKRNHLHLLIIAISVTVFMTAVYVYMYWMIDNSLNKIIKTRESAEAATLAKEREHDFLQTYKANLSKWTGLRDYFVDSTKLVNFIEKIENLDKESGARVTISSIEADDVDNSPSNKEGSVRLRINANGNWDAVMRTLALSEALPYKISINNIKANVADVSTEAGSNNWNISYDVRVAMIAATSTTIKGK